MPSALRRPLRTQPGKLPERSPSFVNGIAFFAGYLARFVAVVTLNERLGRTAMFRKIVTSTVKNVFDLLVNAGILDKPVTHLLIEFSLVFFVLGPAHVKDIGRFLSLDHVSHEILATVVVKATGKVISEFGISLKDFYFESLGTGLFGQEICGNKNDY